MASSTDVDLSHAAKARELLREKLLSPPSTRKSAAFGRDEQKSWPESRRRAFRLKIYITFIVWGNCIQICADSSSTRVEMIAYYYLT